MKFNKGLVKNRSIHKSVIKINLSTEITTNNAKQTTNSRI